MTPRTRPYRATGRSRPPRCGASSARNATYHAAYTAVHAGRRRPRAGSRRNSTTYVTCASRNEASPTTNPRSPGMFSSASPPHERPIATSSSTGTVPRSGASRQEHGEREGRHEEQLRRARRVVEARDQHRHVQRPRRRDTARRRAGCAGVARRGQGCSHVVVPLGGRLARGRHQIVPSGCPARGIRSRDLAFEPHPGTTKAGGLAPTGLRIGCRVLSSRRAGRSRRSGSCRRAGGRRRRGRRPSAGAR